VHNFVGLRWAVWNGQFRYGAAFCKSDPGGWRWLMRLPAANLFNQENRDPVRSINYVLPTMVSH
jgi:pullulanase/glycogen debranching enzyme